jgi:hypothetical protein
VSSFTLRPQAAGLKSKFVEAVMSMAFVDKEFTLTQPDGTELKVRGTEFVRWKRVGRILFELLFVLLIIWYFFWDIRPTFVDNVSKLIGKIAAPEWIADVEKNYQFFVFLFSTFVICMGLTRWLGKRQWYQERISRRKQLKLPVASLFSSDSFSFSYSNLFQGGLIGLALVSWHLMVMLFSSSYGDVSHTLQFRMIPPIAMIAQQSLQLLLMSIFARQHRDTLINSPSLIASSAVLIVILVWILVSSFAEIAIFKDQNNVAFLVQIILTVIVSLCYSYSCGVSEGLKAADPESTYPFVSVKVIEGTDFEEAWLYERTDSDYRIVTKSGSNQIIPASNVKEIKGL